MERQHAVAYRGSVQQCAEVACRGGVWRCAEAACRGGVQRQYAEVVCRGGMQRQCAVACRGSMQRRRAEAACRGSNSMYQRWSAASRGSVQERRRRCTPQWVEFASRSLAIAVAQKGWGTANSDEIQVNGAMEDKLQFSGGGGALIESSKELVLRN